MCMLSSAAATSVERLQSPFEHERPYLQRRPLPASHGNAGKALTLARSPFRYISDVLCCNLQGHDADAQLLLCVPSSTGCRSLGLSPFEFAQHPFVRLGLRQPLIATVRTAIASI
jgi:hypothetical protein